MQLCFGDHTNLSCPRCSCRWPPGDWRQTLHYWSLMGWVGILMAIWRTDRDQKSIISLTVSADSFHGRCFGYGHDGPPRVALLWRTLSNTPYGKEGPKSPEHDDPKLFKSGQLIDSNSLGKWDDRVLWSNSPQSGCAPSRLNLINAALIWDHVAFVCGRKVTHHRRHPRPWPIGLFIITNLFIRLRFAE